MTDITPTEFLAMRLWGWEEAAYPFPDYKDKPYRWYHRGSYDEGQSGRTRGGQWVATDTEGVVRWKWNAFDDWPNFNDWNTIHEMEAKLAERGLLADYVHAIHMAIPADERGDNRIDPMLAKPAQRIAAAVRVLGGGK